EELDRGGTAVRTAVHTDHEVHGNEHRFEQHVEEEHVPGGEDGDHQREEHEHQSHVAGLAAHERIVAFHSLRELHFIPRCCDDDGGEHRREQHHRQPEPVHPDGVGGADRGDPGGDLGELLRCCGAEVETCCHPDR